MLLEFPCGVLGVRDKPRGSGRITVAPDPGPLAWARGTAMTPHGPVRVSWRRAPDGSVEVEADGPPGVPIDVVAPEGR